MHQSVHHFLEPAATMSQLVVGCPQIAGPRQLFRNVHVVKPIQIVRSRSAIGGQFVPDRPDASIHPYVSRSCCCVCVASVTQFTLALSRPSRTRRSRQCFSLPAFDPDRTRRRPCSPAPPPQPRTKKPT